MTNHSSLSVNDKKLLIGIQPEDDITVIGQPPSYWNPPTGGGGGGGSIVGNDPTAAYIQASLPGGNSGHVQVASDYTPKGRPESHTDYITVNGSKGQVQGSGGQVSPNQYAPNGVIVLDYNHYENGNTKSTHVHLEINPGQSFAPVLDGSTNLLNALTNMYDAIVGHSSNTTTPHSGIGSASRYWSSGSPGMQANYDGVSKDLSPTDYATQVLQVANQALIDSANDLGIQTDMSTPAQVKNSQSTNETHLSSTGYLGQSQVENHSRNQSTQTLFQSEDKDSLQISYTQG